MSRRSRKERKRNSQLLTKEDLKKAIQVIEKESKEENPPNIPISVTLITRDDPVGLKKCLTSVKEILLTDGDEICVLDTGSKLENLISSREVVESFGGSFYQEKLTHDIGPLVKKWIPEWYETYEKSNLTDGCLLSFAEAREKCRKLAKHPVQFWIDTDDTLVEEMPGQFRWVIDKLFSDEGLNGRGADSLFLEYKYAFDKSDGSCITTLKRERVVNTDLYKWVGRCHETLIPADDKWDAIRGAGFLQDLRTYIVHHKETADSRATDVRNYVILRNEIKECKDAQKPVDPRTVFYLGNACRGLGRDSDALHHYEELYEVSGSLDDRFLAKYYSGMIWINDRNRRPLDGLDCFFDCVRLRPCDPRSYYAISRCYYALGRHNEALQFFKQGRAMKPLEVNLHADDPQHSDLLPFQVGAMSARELGEHDYAKACALEMNKKYPNHELTKSVIACLQNDEAKTGLIDGVMRIVANEVGEERQASSEEVKSRMLYHFSKLEGVPDQLEKQGISPKEPKRDIDVEKEVVFFCGGSVEEFGPNSTGLGGSEKMVALMAPRLQAAGFEVSVYNNCPRADRGVDKTGVFWWHWGGFDSSKERGTIIYWRSPELLERPVNARKRILWCHDVQDPKRWSDVRVALADQVWVLSEFQATTLGPWREKLGKKVRITRNGLDLSLYEKLVGNVERENKVVFASSPDRGVLTAIKIFQYAKERGVYFCDAKLHIFYGFTKLFLEHNVKAEYRNFPDLGRDANGWEYMQEVHRLVDNDPDIIWRGRVDWETMAKEQASAAVWLYPTRFPEISCMAAQEAQAAGCKVVASDYAALAETIEWDSPCTYKIDPNRIADSAMILDRALAGTDYEKRAKLSQQALKRFGFDGLVEDWTKLINE